MSVKSLRSSLNASERKFIIDEFNNPHSQLDALLLSIKASGAGLNLHWNCSDIIVAGLAENINMVLQALGRTHRIGQLRSQRVWIVTQDHRYDQLLQAAQTKKMLLQIAGEGLIELDDADFEINDDQIEDETADIIDDNERRDKANKTVVGRGNSQNARQRARARPAFFLSYAPLSLTNL